MKTIGGFLALRNGISLDYCFELAIQSMLEFCDAIVVAESESTDGTRELLNDWAKREPKLRIVDFPWTDPCGDTSFYPTWLNFAREHLTTEHCCYLDADEIFSEASPEIIRKSAERGTVVMGHRHNFWRDPQSLIPEGVCLGRNVIRCAPQRMFLPSDYPDPLGRDRETVRVVIKEPALEIFHYGFLRKPEAFFRKARAVQRIWVNSYDPRLEQAEKEGGKWMENSVVSEWVNRLDHFSGSHPILVHEWLRERGFTP